MERDENHTCELQNTWIWVRQGLHSSHTYVLRKLSKHKRGATGDANTMSKPTSEWLSFLEQECALRYLVLCPYCSKEDTCGPTLYAPALQMKLFTTILTQSCQCYMRRDRSQQTPYHTHTCTELPILIVWVVSCWGRLPFFKKRMPKRDSLSKAWQPQARVHVRRPPLTPEHVFTCIDGLTWIGKPLWNNVFQDDMQVNMQTTLCSDRLQKLTWWTTLQKQQSRQHVVNFLAILRTRSDTL